MLLAALALSGASVARAQGTLLLIEIRATNPQPVRPTGPVNDLQEFMAAWAGCRRPPPVDQSRAPLDLTFQVSFKRSGELFGKPRAISFSARGDAGGAAALLSAVAEAVDRCSQMPFTDQMGGAVAGRPFRVRFLDRRDSRKTESHGRQ